MSAAGGWLAGLTAAFVGTWLARAYSLHARLLDAPGERRSHEVATPRGGGIAIVAVVLAGLAWIGWVTPVARPLVAAIAPGYRAVPDPREVDEVFEVPLAFLMAEANLRRVPLQWQGRERSVLEFADRGQPRLRIWRATASILFNLRQRLERA